MTANGLLQVGIYLGLLLLAAKPLGWFMAEVLEGRWPREGSWLRGPERGLYRVAGIRTDEEMDWKSYAFAVLLFNALGLGVVYAILRFQHLLPFNPQNFAATTPDLAFNTAISFASNTNWQSYGGESTLSYFSQMAGLTVQNFLSAATGMAVLAALIRGLARAKSATVGNFWVDVTRVTLYILLPTSLVLAVALVSQGVVQTFASYVTASTLEGLEQTIALGPVASQVAIKQLGTNGGGFFNVNSAHPLENPTPLSNLMEMLAILLIPAALCYTFGRMVNDTRQGWAILSAMLVIFVPLVLGAYAAEQAGNPQMDAFHVNRSASADHVGGNMEGKEVRFGVANSALWATATTAASNGSVNAMHDSFTPLGGLIPMWLMQLGEIIFGGVGSGLYGMLVFAIIAVFIAGLMVGRTPEYLGKKIQAFEMKMAAIVILVTPLVVLLGTAIAVVGPGLEYAAADTGEVKSNLNNPGAHGFSEILYAFSSAGNNNGSAFAGLTANESWYNIALGLAMLVGRYWIIVPVLAIAGSLAAKQRTPASVGTLPTHSPLFVVLLVGTILLVGALTYVPALALGPIVEHLQMIAVR
ncbi:potassium-transporting ATPase subunit KdpA [bacterium]|nr:potassium-transporting ATPase subunit KdpA [bacterium]